MTRANFATSAEYHADADRRAPILLNGHIASIDAAIEKLERNRHRCGPHTFSAIRDELSGFRRMCRNYLAMPSPGATACGMMGPNGYGANITDLIARVDKIAVQGRYVPYAPPATLNRSEAA